MTKEQALKILRNAIFSEEWQGNEELTTAYYMAFEVLENKLMWIPVGERLPQQTGEYLVTVYMDDIFWTDKFGYTPTTEGGWYDLENPNQNDIKWNDFVIAWMPLPEPYYFYLEYFERIKEYNCKHFYKGYCAKYEGGCFRQCESEE